MSSQNRERPDSEPGTIPGLQRTTPQELRAALRPGQVPRDVEVESLILFPDAVQRAALAERCSAEPGWFYTPASGTVPSQAGTKALKGGKLAER